MKQFFLYLCLSFLAFGIQAQEQEEKNNFSSQFKDAILSIEEKKYRQAIDIMEELIKQQPDNANLNYRLGTSYAKIPQGDEDAIKYLEVATKTTVANYDIFSSNETNAPLESIFALAEVYLDYGEVDKAIEQYELFIVSVSKKHRLIPYAHLGIEHAKNAKQFMADPVDVKISNLGGKINSEFHEHSPVLTLDEEIIYFTSRRIRKDSSNANKFDQEYGWHYEDIYVAYKDEDGVWGEPELLEFSRINDHDATVSLSADGSELYIYRDDLNGTLLKSKQAGAIWVSPTSIGNNINSKSFENHMSVSIDNQILYFSSDRKGGFGGMDIYMCKKLPTGSWGLPVNLGPVINTQYDDNAPNIHPDSRTLYFTSRGHKNIGGYDIFSSTIDEEGNWTKPTNLGYPLNTTHDEEIFYVSPDGKRGYFSSYTQGGYGQGDLYMVELQQVDETGLTLLKGKIIVPDGTEFPENIRILINDNETGKLIGEARPNARNGSYVFIIPPGKNYKLSYMLDGKEFYAESTFVPMGSEYKVIQKEVSLDPVRIESDSTGVIVRNISEGPVWQLRYLGVHKTISEGQSILYLSAETGNVLYEEPIDKNGYFKYYKLPGDAPYLFKITNLVDVNLCDESEIVLVGDTAGEKYRMVPDNYCIYSEFEQNSAIVRFYDPEVKITDKFTATYLDENDAVLKSSKIKSDGYFDFMAIDAHKQYRVKIEGEGIDCKKGIVLITRNDRRDYLKVGTNDCVFDQPLEDKFVCENMMGLSECTKAQYLSEEGKVVFTFDVRDAVFTFKRLPKDEPYRIKLVCNDQTLCLGGEMTFTNFDGSGYKLKSDEDCIYQVYDVMDPQKVELKREEKPLANQESLTKEEKLQKKFESTLVETTVANDKIAYKTNFGYNKNQIPATDKDFVKFIDEAVAIYKQKGVLKIAIESGASKVPTKSFKDNSELARTRAYKAKDFFVAELVKRGVDASKVDLANVSYLVQGPDYKKDAFKVKLYETFQYVKLWSVNAN